MGPTRHWCGAPGHLAPCTGACDLAEAALTEPLCVAYNALVVKSRIRPGDIVEVLGPGPIGLMATRWPASRRVQIVLAGRDRRRPGAWIRADTGRHARGGSDSRRCGVARAAT